MGERPGQAAALERFVLLVSHDLRKSGRRSLRGEWLGLGLALLLGAGCRCRDEAAPASAPPSSAPFVDCRRDGTDLIVPPGAGPHETDAGGRDSETELPFAVEPGVALEHGGQFFVTALRHEPRATVALLARLPVKPGGSAKPELTELATLRGEPPPPRLTTAGADVVVGMFEARPAGYQIRFARLSPGDRAAPLTWWDGPSASREAKGFELAASGERVLAVWDDWSAREKLGRIFVALVPAAPPGAPEARAAANGAKAEPATPRAISPASDDVEEPRVAARPGGYWLAWLVNTGSGGHARVYDPGEAETDAKGASASATGARAIVVLALDSAGSAVGRPRRVTSAHERVVGYDLTSDAAGTAWITWRQGAASAGASGGRISVAALAPDQLPRSLLVRQDEVGPGEPSWVGESTGGGSWLTFPDQRDRSVLSSIAERAGALVASAPLALGQELEGAAVLAGLGQRVLFAEPRGRALRLAVAKCSLAAAAVPAAATPSARPDAGAQP